MNTIGLNGEGDTVVRHLNVPTAKPQFSDSLIFMKDLPLDRRVVVSEIIADILSVAGEGEQSKTAIMRKANLNLGRANRYIWFLLSSAR